jgi:translation initiation factor IF-1
MKEESIKLNGVIVEANPNAIFKVELDNKHIVTAHLAGKMRQNNIKIIIGDKVTVEMSPYDLTKARIIFRQK